MNKYISKRIIDDSWDFLTANTKEYSHCYHIYPAMMIPQIARKLINQYTNGTTKILFDPYCGTGTSLVEANIMGISNVGTDLNPLATLISKVKNTNYDSKIVKEIIEEFQDKFYVANINGIKDFEIPKFQNIDFWFSNEIQKKLAFIQSLINSLSDEIRSFFLLPFSETIREGSFTRNSEFKLFRIPDLKMKNYNPDIFGIFINKLNRNLAGLIEFNKVVKESKTKIYNFNTCEGIPSNVLDDGIDVIVTSPPYGDSRTTVAYGQFSRLTNQWLGFEEASQVDNILMGGKNGYTDFTFEIESSYDDLQFIKSQNEKRYNEVISFLFDYKKSIDNISKYLNSKAVVCYVVGNRRVKNRQIQLDAITAELFERNGLKHISTFVRNIPNKRMPSKNSPTNIIGDLSETMTNEYIVVLKKEF